MRPSERARRPWWVRMTIDVTPLRASRDYRLLWFGQLVSLSGSQLRFVAVPYQVWLLTRSPLAVGMIGLFQAVPLMVFSLWGGVVADHVDRRKLLLLTQVGLAGVSVGLAVGTATGFARLPYLYALTAAGATLSALDGPARQSMIPSLVGRERIPAAMALNQVLFQTSGVIGPAVGGLLIAWVGLATTYWVDVATYGAAITAVAMMRPPARRADGGRPGLRSLVEGLRYLRGNRVLLSTMGIDLMAMFLSSPRALYPFFAEEVFAVGPQGLGLLFAAPGAGALAGALFAGWVQHVRRQGAAVLIAVAGWGLAIAAFGIVNRWFWLGLVFLAAAGMSDVFSAIFRGTILQMMVPDRLRGRMTAVNLMVVISGPRLGEVWSGAFASLASPVFAVGAGGLACVAGVVIVAMLVPALRRYEVDPDRLEADE